MTAEAPIRRWHTPPLQHAGRGPELSEEHREELEQLRSQAREEGFESGREEALLQHRAQLAERLDRLDQLLSALEAPYEELNGRVAEELTRLAGRIAKQLLRREMKIAPESIMGVVREAITSLPEDRSGIKVYLNHQDAELVRELSQLAERDSSWKLVDDPTINRGDCVVTMGSSLVDASLEARVNAIMAGLLGGDRAQDKPA